MISDDLKKEEIVKKKHFQTGCYETHGKFWQLKLESEAVSPETTVYCNVSMQHNYSSLYQ